MLEAVVCELTPVVALFVQPHHRGHIQLPEYVRVVLGRPRVHAVVDFLTRGSGTAERHILARHDDVEIAVLDALVILVPVQMLHIINVGRGGAVQLHVEGCEVDEVEVLGALEARHAVGKGQSVCANAVAGVSVR